MKRLVLLPLSNTGTINIEKVAFLRKVREIADSLESSFNQIDLYREAIKILICLGQGTLDFEVEINQGVAIGEEIEFTATFGPVIVGGKRKSKKRGKRRHKTRKFR